MQAVRILTRDDKESSAGGNRKMSWSFDIGYCLAERGECSGGSINVETSNRLMAAVRGVEESTIRMDFNLGGGIRLFVISGKGGDGFFGCESVAIAHEMGHRVGKFIDGIDPGLGRVNGEVARTYAGRRTGVSRCGW